MCVLARLPPDDVAEIIIFDVFNFVPLNYLILARVCDLILAGGNRFQFLPLKYWLGELAECGGGGDCVKPPRENFMAHKKIQNFVRNNF